MQLIIHLDEQGIIKVDLSTPSPGTEEGRRFFQALRSDIEQLGRRAQEVAREAGSGEDEAA